MQGTHTRPLNGTPSARSRPQTLQGPRSGLGPRRIHDVCELRPEPLLDEGVGWYPVVRGEERGEYLHIREQVWPVRPVLAHGVDASLDEVGLAHGEQEVGDPLLPTVERSGLGSV